VIVPAPPPAKPDVDRPRIVQPAPYQASFGRVVGAVPGWSDHVVLLADGRRLAVKRVQGTRVTLQVTLPPRDVSLRLVAVGDAGRRAASRPVGPVFGLPPRGAPRGTGSVEVPSLARRVTRLARAFHGTAAVFVQDLVTGRGAAWNARARFPAASTLKLAIAVETLRAVPAPPAPGSELDGLLRAMLIRSDNRAANQLEVFFGGSTSGGSARVNAMMRALGLVDSEMYGGYEIEEDARLERAIPIRVESQPNIARTKYSTAWDLARLVRYVHLAAGGRGALIRRVGGLTPAEARYLLYLLVHVGDRGKLARFLPGSVALAHKAGWITSSRHDIGIVYWPRGAFVAAVMTWSAGGVGPASDVLAGRVAEAALQRFRATG
jgi:beta-lactamase class A